MALEILGSPIINDQRMVIDVDKIGIKTSSPTAELHVVGDGFFTGNLTVPSITGTISTAINVIGGIASVSNLTVTSSADVSSISGTTLTYSTGRFTSINGNIGIVTNLSGTNLNYLGIGTLGSLSIGSTQVISDNFQLKNIISLDATTIATIESAIVSSPNTFTDLRITGVSTFINGPVFIGATTSTGTTSQLLQVTGGAYVSGNLGIGITNPTQTLDLNGSIKINNKIYDFTNNPGSVNYVLTSGGPNGVWTWQSVTDVGAGVLDSIFIRKDASNVGNGTATTFDFYSDNLLITQPSAGIASVRLSDSPTFSNLNLTGVSTISVNSSNNALRITQSGLGNALIVEDETNPDVTPFVVTNSGNVGIGTTNATSKLTVAGRANITDIDVSSLNISGISTLGFFDDTQVISQSVSLGPNKIYYSVHKDVIIDSGSTLSIGSGSTIVFDRFNNLDDVKVKSLISTGIITALNFVGDLEGSSIYATSSGISTISQGLTGTPNITVGSINATSANFSGIVTAFNFVGDLSGSGNLIGISTLGFFTDDQVISENLSLTDNINYYTVHKNIIVGSGVSVTIGSGSTVIFDRLNNLDDVSAKSLSLENILSGSSSSTTTTTSQTSIHEYISISLYRSVEYTIQATEGTNFHLTKILCIHDGATVYVTEYGTVFNNTLVGTYDVDINNGKIRLLVTPASSGSTTYKINFSATTS